MASTLKSLKSLIFLLILSKITKDVQFKSVYETGCETSGIDFFMPSNAIVFTC